MFDIMIEVFTNFFQTLLFVSFVFLYLEKPKSKMKKAVPFIICSIVLFSLLSYSTFVTQHIIFDELCFLVILIIYSIFCFKDNIFNRIFIPLMAFLVNTIITFAFSYSVSFFTGQSHIKLITEPTIYRYLCIVLINLTNLIVFFVIIKFKKHGIRLLKLTDIISFVILPIVVLLIIYATFYIMVLTKYQSNIIVYLAVICVCMLAVAAVVWYSVYRISKDNKIKTELLLIEQKTKLYEENILQTSSQIEKMSRFKHDIKNNLFIINRLIKDNHYKDAQKVCSDISGELQGIYTPLNTRNPLLNAVVNVEQEKACVYSIDFSVNVKDEMIDYYTNTDIVSIIGNMCDNAIEYLKDCENSIKQMKLEIDSHNNHYIISCKNRIKNSVLEKNPSLLTNKIDKGNHGKGIEILKSIAQKYEGELNIFEEEGYFYSTIVLVMKSVPEKV